MGIFSLINFCIIFIAYLPVAAGSPGPFDKKMPSGFNLTISLAPRLQGTTTVSQLKFEKYLKIFFLILLVGQGIV